MKKILKGREERPYINPDSVTLKLLGKTIDETASVYNLNISNWRIKTNKVASFITVNYVWNTQLITSIIGTASEL
jgi:hypothetical protein